MNVIRDVIASAFRWIGRRSLLSGVADAQQFQDSCSRQRHEVSVMTIRSGRLAGSGVRAFGAVAGVTSRSMAAPASAFGPEVSVGEPRDGYVGRLDVCAGPWPGRHADHGDRREAARPIRNSSSSGAPSTGSWKVADAEYHGRDYTPVAYRDRQGEDRRRGPPHREDSSRRTISASCTTSCCSRPTACSRRSASRST